MADLPEVCHGELEADASIVVKDSLLPAVPNLFGDSLGHVRAKLGAAHHSEVLT